MKFGLFMDDSKRKQQEVVDKMEKKDPTTLPEAAVVIETTNITSPTASPIIIKIEQPKQPIKQMKDKNSTENSAVLAKQIVCALLFIATFATVMTFLWHYLDPSAEKRHQQFRLNMTHDLNINVSQDEPGLVWFVREVQMKKYPMTFLEKLPMESFNFSNSQDLASLMAKYIGEDLLKKKQSGFYFQSLTGSNGVAMAAPWLTESLKWGGVIVEPDPRKYFSYRRRFAHRNATKIVHASLSPRTYPKEVTLHYEEDESEVKVETLQDEPERVKCFPLYTILLALNQTNVDLLSLGCQGLELEILLTIPFEKVNIEVISIHLIHYYHKTDIVEYIQDLIAFMKANDYKLMKVFERNYIFKRVGGRI